VEGTPFGRYRLIELLGRGGMGEVWRAHDTVTDRVVAIKVLPSNLSEDEEFQQRFRREAHTAARLDSPHVVPIYDYGEIDGRLFVSMRLIKGRDLGTVLADGSLDPARAVRIIDQVAEALHAAHEIGLIHRDIKPSNILLDDRDFAYLIDFGIARVAGETRMTKTGNTIGTFAYIAPERLDGRGEEDARADIYSLACVLYECLTGQPPFADDTMPRLIVAHLNAPPPRPSISRPDVPAQFDQVIATGMAKNPDQRYASTVELANAARDAITTPLAPPTLLATAPADPPAPAATLLNQRPWPAPAPDPVRQEPTHPHFANQQRSPGWPPVPPPQPNVWPPPQVGTPQSRPARRSATPWIITGVAAAVVVVLIAGITYFVRQPSTTSQPTGSQPSSSESFTPVAEPALEGLLLSPDQINTVMGTTDMAVSDASSEINDFSPNVADKACLPLAGPAGAGVYAGSGWTAVRKQQLDQPDRTHLVGQAVVLFPAAHDATAFFTASAQSWPACRQFIWTGDDHREVNNTVGPVSNTDGTLGATLTKPGTSYACQRALTVANNVAIDVTACSYNLGDSAVSIARQIAAKVPTT